MKIIFKNKKYIYTFLVIILLSIILTITINRFLIKKTPIKIGLVTTLTGSASSFFVDIRNATSLAVKEINQNGGIKGRQIKLVSKDDKINPETGKKVIQELIDEDVKAIIGPGASTVADAIIPLINKTDILMISPTVKSMELTGIDDNCLKINTPINLDAEITAHVAIDRYSLKKIAVVYDMINPKFTIPNFNYFKKEVEKIGGKISVTITFDSRNKFSSPNIAKKIIKSGADGLYITADATHTALICQHLRMNNSEIKIIVNSWALADSTFIKMGGKSVENVIGLRLYSPELNNENLLNLNKIYFDQFKQEINSIGLLSYETMQILFYALSKTNDSKKLKDIILKKKVFNGVESKFVFDQYGDSRRPMHIVEIRNGKMVSIGKIDPDDFF